MANLTTLDKGVLFLCVRGGSRLTGSPHDWRELLLKEIRSSGLHLGGPPGLFAAPAQHSLRQRALRFEAEYRTVLWIRSENEERGLAPTPQEVYTCFQRHSGHPERQHQASTRSARKFAARMRKSWRIGFRKFDAHDDTTPDERAFMARSSIILRAARAHTTVMLAGLDLASRFGFTFRVHFLVLFWDHFLFTFLSPKLLALWVFAFSFWFQH